MNARLLTGNLNENVKVWIDEAQRGVKTPLKPNPFIELIGGYIQPKCKQCQSYQAGDCEGNNLVNLTDLVGENPKVE